jgi:hypothetical protein
VTVQLTLPQVDLEPPPGDELEHRTGKKEPGSVKLFDKISHHWPATTPPNPEHLHIMVELSSGKRCVHWVGEISLTVSRLSLTSFLTLLRLSPLPC